MSMDNDRRDPEKPITEQEGAMFAAEPIWERNRKRRGLGGRKGAAAAPMVSPEPRTFAAERDYEEPMALDEPMTLDRPLSDRPAADYSRAEYAEMGAGAATATTTHSTLAAEEDTGLIAPIGRPSTRADREPRSRGTAPAAIGAAAVVGLLAIGAAGWFMTRDDGVPELAPGSTTAEIATAPLPPVDLPPNPPAATAPVQAAAAPPPAATARFETPRAQARVAPRARPAAAAPSASTSGANASTTTTLPDGPQPYSTLNPGATPPPVNPPATQAAPPPTEAPAQIPATPPTITPEPTPTPPTEDPTPPPTLTLTSLRPA